MDTEGNRRLMFMKLITRQIKPTVDVKQMIRVFLVFKLDIFLFVGPIRVPVIGFMKNYRDK